MNIMTRFRAGVGPLVVGLLAGCQSSRPAFLFAPAAPYAATTRPALAVPVAAAPVAALPAAPAQASTKGSPVARQPGPGLRRARVAAPAAAPVVLATVVPAGAEAAPAVAHRPHRATARTAENGLGGIALFFIGVALALLAGLGALVALIPGVSFLGGVGLAAAGLLVIFLLYSLLSGGGKKKKK